MATERYIPESWRELVDTVRALSAPGKGIVALDESNATCTKRFEAVGAESTPETRRKYRCLLLGAPGVGEHISGAILYDETLRQQSDDGSPLPRMMAGLGVLPGIKVDTGAKPLAGAPGEQVTEGLDGLRERLQEYRELGARFAKWRAVIASARACRAASASTPTPMPWPATRRCARRPGWCPSWSRRCCWRVTTIWRAVSR